MIKHLSSQFAYLARILTPRVRDDVLTSSASPFSICEPFLLEMLMPMRIAGMGLSCSFLVVL